MSAASVTLVVEGDTDIPFARKIVSAAGLSIAKVVDAGGKPKLDANLSGYNAASRFGGFFVLRDLDQDAECAPELLAKLLPSPNPGMCLRIPVRALESWVLGDSEQVAAYLKIREGSVPLAPEREADPKRALVALASRSTSSRIRRDFCPPQGAKRKAGPGYEAALIEFGESKWRWGPAQQRCPSLQRCIQALRDLKKELAPA